MPEYNIKISELDKYTAATGKTEDFFPLVDSSSMTTYRATIQDIGSMMTHSIYADTSSYAFAAVSASHANYADSASYALSSSHAISASHALVADIANYYPPQQFQVSCSWASRSLQSWYSTRSIDTDIHGYQFFFPFWNTPNVPGTNGALEVRSTLFFSQSGWDGQGPIIVDPDMTFRGNPYYTASNAYPWFSQSGWWNPLMMNMPNDTNGDSLGYIGGLFSPWPIISGVFVGTDKKGWSYSTSSHWGAHTTIWTGSFVSGGYVNLDKSFDQMFNNKWLRIAVTNTDPEWPNSGHLADNVMPFEGPGSWMHTGMFGRIRVIVTSTVLFGGSKQYQSIDLSLQNYYWSGDIQAVVHHAEGAGLVKAIRITDNSGHYGSPTNGDPFQTIDLLLDTYNSSDHMAWVMCESFGGVRFMNQPVLDPPPLSQSVVLQFPPRPGFYSNGNPYNSDMTYNFSGRRMIVDPSGTEVTQSGMAIAHPYSLNVSGGIQTNTRYYCDNAAGMTTTVLANTNVNLYFSGGILIDKFPPDTYVPPVVTPCGAGPFILKVGGNIDPDHIPATHPMWYDYTYTVGSNAGQITLNYNANADHVADRGDPCRWQLIYNGAVVQDTDWKGFSHTILGSRYLTYEAAELLELSQSLAPHAIPGATYGWPNTIPSTYIPGEVSGVPTAVYPEGSGSIYWYKPDGNPTTITVRVMNPLEDPCSFTMSCPGQTINHP
jgi:hypothetical protein